MYIEKMRICVFQPDIPQNLGALLRISACLDVPVDIIEPCGFPFSEKKFKRTAMDYIRHANFKTFIDYQSFKDQQSEDPSSRHRAIHKTRGLRQQCCSQRESLRAQ